MTTSHRLAASIGAAAFALALAAAANPDDPPKKATYTQDKVAAATATVTATKGSLRAKGKPVVADGVWLEITLPGTDLDMPVDLDKVVFKLNGNPSMFNFNKNLKPIGFIKKNGNKPVQAYVIRTKPEKVGAFAKKDVKSEEDTLTVQITSLMPGADSADIEVEVAD